MNKSSKITILGLICYEDIEHVDLNGMLIEAAVIAQIPFSAW